jgi:hypothetical protein
MIYNDLAGREFVEGRLLEILLPKGGTVAMLEAYFDESAQGGVFNVAGFAFAKPQVKKFSKQWSKLFSPYGFCHMTDLHARQEQFEGINDDEASRLCVEAINIINERTAFGVAVGCNLSEIDDFLPKHIEGFGNAYPFCCHIAMQMLGTLVSESGFDDRIAYVFESGHEYAAEAYRFMAITDGAPVLKAAYRHYSHAFVPKEDAVPLQAADLFAWEYARYWNLTVSQQKIKMRKSLASLLSSGLKTIEFNKRYKINFFTGSPLRNALEKVKALGLLQLRET